MEDSGRLDNTLVIVVSDNGASGEGGPNGSVNEMKFMNGIPDDLQQNLAMLEELADTSDPCIIAWPAGTTARGELRGQYHHAIDLVPTILDVLGVEPPATIKGHVQSPFDGVSMRYSFDNDAAPTARTTQFSRCWARGPSGACCSPTAPASAGLPCM